VVEQLIKGTSATDAQATVPKSTTILGVSVREGICYVNLDSKFVSDSYDLSPEVAIYSIVNSVIENGNVTKVQILIDGASDVVYKKTIDLSRPLEWNATLLEVK
jgi:germination protein M